MNTSYIEAEGWKELREKHPGAYALLQGSALRGEWSALSAELERGCYGVGRKDWVTSRLADLRAAGLDCLQDLY